VKLDEQDALYADRSTCRAKPHGEQAALERWNKFATQSEINGLR